MVDPVKFHTLNGKNKGSVPASDDRVSVRIDAGKIDNKNMITVDGCRSGFMKLLIQAVLRPGFWISFESYRWHFSAWSVSLYHVFFTRVVFHRSSVV